MLSIHESVDFVIGVGTHKLSHTTSVVAMNGAELATATIAVDAFGYRRMLAFAKKHAPGRRLCAIEGTGSFGAGLTTYLLEQSDRVAKIDRPARPARRNGAKSDELDATRAAREALGREHLAQPRRRGDREAIRVLLRTRQGAIHAGSRALCHLKSLVVTAPELLRYSLHKMATDELVARCARLRTTAQQSTEHRATIMAIRLTARRVLMLEAEANEHETQIELLVKDAAPALLAEPGIGALTADKIICAWSHPGRLRSEAAFAKMAGAAPLPASSGQVTRHRLNRCGDRLLNCALHTIVLSRPSHHEETRRYAVWRQSEGRSNREIRRCLKRFLARRLFPILERTAVTPVVATPT
ncbi:transposase [Nitrospira sp. Nam74]